MGVRFKTMNTFFMYLPTHRMYRKGGLAYRGGMVTVNMLFLEREGPCSSCTGRLADRPGNYNTTPRSAGWRAVMVEVVCRFVSSFSISAYKLHRLPFTGTFLYSRGITVGRYRTVPYLFFRVFYISGIYLFIFLASEP